MIQVIVTFSDKGEGETCGVAYTVKNPNGTAIENIAALATLGLLNVFFENPDENDFLTTEQGARVRKKIDEITKYIDSKR